jgi:hypothetical protein
VVVYDKRAVDGASNPNYTSRFYPANIGDEGLPYLLHIITHYHRLPPVMVFSQADPFDHLQPYHPHTALPCLLRYALAHRPRYLALCRTNFEFLSLTSQGYLRLSTFRGFQDLEALRFGYEPSNPLRFFTCGSFVTTREGIHARPLQWWIDLYRKLNDGKHGAESCSVPGMC